MLTELSGPFSQEIHILAVESCSKHKKVSEMQAGGEQGDCNNRTPECQCQEKSEWAAETLALLGYNLNSVYPSYAPLRHATRATEWPLSGRHIYCYTPHPHCQKKKTIMVSENRKHVLSPSDSVDQEPENDLTGGSGPGSLRDCRKVLFAGT